MRAKIHKSIVFPPGFNELFSLMTMIKWINASKLHEIKEVLKLDLQNSVLGYLILISMKMQRSRPTLGTSKSTSRLSHVHMPESFAHADAAALTTLEEPHRELGTHGLAAERPSFCCQTSARELETLWSLPFAWPCVTWPKDSMGSIKQHQLEARLDQGVLRDRKHHVLLAREVMGILCSHLKLT